jgi:hypothetical protein
MTENGKRFVEANGTSPVVCGVVIGRGGEGCRYTLADGSSFRLSSDDCKEIGKPRWDDPS